MLGSVLIEVRKFGGKKCSFPLSVLIHTYKRRRSIIHGGAENFAESKQSVARVWRKRERMADIFTSNGPFWTFYPLN